MRSRIVVTISLIQSAAIVALIALVIFGWIRLHHDEASQLSNRTGNVHTWCLAINQGRDYDRALVRDADPHVAYRLRDLPCHHLESSTLHSASR